MTYPPILAPHPILWDVEFSNNWNNKLDCHVFTTIRLKAERKVGEPVNLYLRKSKSEKIFLGEGVIRCIAERRLATLRDEITYLDTGYNADKTRDILRKMYQAKNIDWDLQPIFIYWIEWTHKVPYNETPF